MATAMTLKKKSKERDARVSVTSAATSTTSTNWQDAMTGGGGGGGGQQISHGHGDRGTPTNQQFNSNSSSSSTNTSSPNGLRGSVSFACDNVDILAEVEDLKPPASTSRNDHDRGDDEGYEKFLALLASSPAPAQAPASSPSTSSMTLPMAEHDPPGVSLACGDLDTRANNYFPPSAQAQAHPAADDGQGELFTP